MKDGFSNLFSDTDEHGEEITRILSPKAEMAFAKSA